MKAKWTDIKNRFEAFELRERALMVGALVAVVYLAWDFIFLQPIGEAKKVAVAQERVANQSIKAAEAELTVLTSVSERDPDERLKLELAQLQKKLDALDGELSSLAVGLIEAKKLPVMLHQMLMKTQLLKLASLKTLPVELVELHSDEGNAVDKTLTKENREPASVAQLFKHGVQVELEGSYRATYELLKALEDSEWQFYWESIDYKVNEYPNASVTLKIFTLASDKGVFDRDTGAY